MKIAQDAGRNSGKGHAGRQPVKDLRTCQPRRELLFNNPYHPPLGLGEYNSEPHRGLCFSRASLPADGVSASLSLRDQRVVC